jgi:murein DD-endopeptidase MepM/ murein hydrolase activator NlpD
MKFSSRIFVIISCLILVLTFINPISVQATTQSAPTSLIAKGKYVPASVTSTGATIPAQKGVELSWTAPSLAQKYEIHRSTSASGPFILITTINAPATRYFDTKVNIGVVYFYKIRAAHTHLIINRDYSSYTNIVNANYVPVARIDASPKEYRPVIDGPTSKVGYTTVGIAPYVPTYKSVKFTTSNSNVCSVSSTGVLTGKLLGTATITITSIESPTVKTTVLCSPIKYLRPAAGGITDYFGNRKHPVTGLPDFHYGIDISKTNGLRIVATREGVVKTIQSVSKDGRGKFIDIDHGGGIVSRYQHLDQLYVTIGQRVVQGQQIAKMGTTGVSTGVHLHFELSINGTRVNPLNYINMNSTFVCTSGCR